MVYGVNVDYRDKQWTGTGWSRDKTITKHKHEDVACQSKAWHIWGRPTVRRDCHCTTEESDSLADTSKVVGLFSAFTSSSESRIK